jgi:outer membrane protein TolC
MPGKSIIAAVAAQTIRRPVVVLAGAGLLLILSLSLLPRIQLQFFPGGDRNQIVLELELSAGTHVEATSEAARVLEEELLPDERVRHIATFVGRSAPAFYYNLTGRSNSPNFAQLLVTTRSQADVPEIAARARSVAREKLAGITFVARELEQGPPASAPVAIRLYSEDRAALAQGIRALFAEARSIEGTRDVRHDLDVGGLAYTVDIEEAAALARGTSMPGIAQALLSRTRGLPSGEFRGGREPARIVVRAPEGEKTPLEELPGTLLFPKTAGAEVTPLGGVARGQLSLKPATIRRENGRRLATLFSELEPGYGYNDVLAVLGPRLPELLPDGVTYEIGGAAESSQEANSAILEASYLGVGILLLILLLQFRSFVRLGLILLTVPLAAVGVIPGLVIFGEPFGFTSLLGTISLIGIVVNNAIILMDTIEGKRREMPIEEAIPQSVLERMRPILLTVLTTVCGLMPLLFSSSSLWPPFASAMISGLLASTVMTLLVVPAAYYLIYRRRSDQDVTGFPGSWSVLAVLFLLLFTALAPVPAAHAEELSLSDALKGARGAPAVRSAEAELRAEEYALRAERREAWLPALSLDGSYLRREEEVTTSFGPMIGDVTQLPDDEKQLSVTLEQPLLDLSAQESDITSRQSAVDRRRAELSGARNRASLEALAAYLHVRRVIAERAAATESRDALEAQLERVRRSVEAGRLLRSDQLRLEVELRSLEQELAQLGRAREIAEMELARKAGRARSARSDSETGGPGDSELTTAPITLEAPAVRRWLATAPRTVRGRSELRALEAAIDGVSARRRGVLESATPEVRLRLSGVRQFDTALEPEQWIEGELTLSWTPVARGVRHARREELTARRESLKAQRRDALEGGSIQLANVRNTILSALERAEVAEQNVVQEEQLRDETEELYLAGRRPLSDFVEAQARVQRARVNERIALFDALEAAGRLAYLTGTPVADVVAP